MVSKIGWKKLKTLIYLFEICIWIKSDPKNIIGSKIIILRRWFSNDFPVVLVFQKRESNLFMEIRNLWAWIIQIIALTHFNFFYINWSIQPQDDVVWPNMMQNWLKNQYSTLSKEGFCSWISINLDLNLNSKKTVFSCLKDLR